MPEMLERYSVPVFFGKQNDIGSFAGDFHRLVYFLYAVDEAVQVFSCVCHIDVFHIIPPLQADYNVRICVCQEEFAIPYGIVYTLLSK